MKLFLFVVVSCLALHNGKGAPRTAVYKFVRCNPEGDQANCVTHQSPEMAWSPDLPVKLPASTAQYLEAKPVEEETPMVEKDEGEEKMMNQEEESPGYYMPEEGSGGYYEGSGSYMAAFVPVESETGSGGDSMGMRRLFPSRSRAGVAKPEEKELREDHLLQL